jgi:hypothetical protein
VISVFIGMPTQHTQDEIRAEKARLGLCGPCPLIPPCPAASGRIRHGQVIATFAASDPWGLIDPGPPPDEGPPGPSQDAGPPPDPVPPDAAARRAAKPRLGFDDLARLKADPPRD